MINETEPVHLTFSEIEDKCCPAPLRKFLMIRAAWNRNGTSGSSDKEFNNSTGRQNILKIIEDLMIEGSASDIWISGLLPLPDQDEQALNDFRAQHGIPDGLDESLLHSHIGQGKDL